MLGRVAFQLFLGCRDGFVFPVARQDYGVQLCVFGILGMSLIVIHEVSVEIDVLFGDTPYPGKAVTVQRVDKNEADVIGQGIGFAAIEEACDNAGAAKALNAMGCRVAQKNVRRVFAAEQGDVCINRFAIRPGRTRIIGRDTRAGFFGGGEEGGKGKKKKK